MARLNSSGWKSGDLRIWSGEIEDIPNGWELAQEMIDRAVVGAGGQYTKGQQFGADSAATNSTTLSVSQMPSHNHSLQSSGGLNDSSYNASASFSARTNYTSSNGSSGSHHHGNVDTRQKSIAVIWIRKL